MELDIQSFLPKGQTSNQQAIRTALKKAIESAVHLHAAMAPRTLAESAAASLHTELARLGYDDEETLQFAFETLICAVSRPKEKEIERLIVEIDRLKRHLYTEEEEMRRTLRELFGGMESAVLSLPDAEQETWREALENAQLEHVEGLGILEETLEAALINALEEAEAVEKSIREVVRHIIHKALGEGVLSAPRIRAILSTALNKAAELAEATPTRADAVIHGTVYGINDALITTVRQLKEQLRFAPDEIKSGHVANWQELIRMLSRSDELYREIIDGVAAKSSPFVRKKLQNVSDILGDQFAELKRISHETVDVAKEKLATLAKEAAVKGAELKSQLTEEAKKLGTKAWKKAMEMAEAYKQKKERE